VGDQTEVSHSPIAVNLTQAAALLGCSVRAVRELVWAGKLRYTKIGKRFLLDPAELREYFHRQLGPSVAPTQKSTRKKAA
jgi:excisionase family DNA binding protein